MRYAMVSYSGAAGDYGQGGPDDHFHPFANAKHDADAYLRRGDLDYTILGSGQPTAEPAT